jgi:biotin transport system ATP-binding protein
VADNKSDIDWSAGIRFSGVTAERGGRAVLRDISLHLKERRIGLIGVNGSGKSSLVRLLNGLLEPRQGSLELFGRAIGERGFRPARHVGFIFQNPDHQLLFPTVEEELAFGLDQLGVPKKEASERALALLAGQGLESLAGRAVHELSEGQKQLVCILAVLIMEPALLVLDEPFTSLDLPTRRRIMEFLEGRPEMQIMISHDLEGFEGFERILWLEEGRVAGDGPPGELLPAYRAAMAERKVAL